MSAIVFVHGWGVRASVLDALREALAARFETSAPALPGYGRASCMPYTLDRLADEIAREAPAKCTVVGWSLGALVALAWARSRPDQVERLALLAGTPCFVQRGGWACAMAGPVFDDFALSLVRDCESTLSRFAALQALGDRAAGNVARRLRQALAPCDAQSVGALAHGLALLRDSDLRFELATVRQPTLIVHGARDAVVPIGAADYLAAALPNARLKRIEDAAHAPFISQTERVAQLLAEHLDAR
ncbi:MAG TPA: alpha/beta fold hydrolase [Burkholderiales bacterium]|nr:alpha/beta fold hydrolase [Burkholderiales bacterium]